MTVKYVFNRDEIQEKLPYQLISEGTSRSAWNTTSRKQAFNKLFLDENQRELARTIIFNCNRWNLVSGIPDKYECNLEMLRIWSKLAGFCSSL